MEGNSRVELIKAQVEDFKRGNGISERSGEPAPTRNVESLRESLVKAFHAKMQCKKCPDCGSCWSKLVLEKESVVKCGVTGMHEMK